MALLSYPAVRKECFAGVRDDPGRAKRRLRTARSSGNCVKRATLLALDGQLTKDQILANYLNIANFGDGAYGVKAAAEHSSPAISCQQDFNDLVQAGGLAGMVNSHSRLRPSPARKRRSAVATWCSTSDGDSKYLNKAPGGVREELPVGAVERLRPSHGRLPGGRHRRVLLRLRAGTVPVRPGVRSYPRGARAAALRGRPDDQDLVSIHSGAGGSTDRQWTRSSSPVVVWPPRK